MAEWNAPATLTTPGGTVTFNAATGDTYLHDPGSCQGLDMAEVRAPIDNAPQTDGGLVHNFFLGPRHVTLGGELLVRTGTTEASTATARNVLEAALTAACLSIIRADGTYSWTPTGGALHTITVRCDIPVNYPGGFLKTYLFGLVAADPTIA